MILNVFYCFFCKKLDVLFIKVMILGVELECFVDIGFIFMIMYFGKYFDILDVLCFKFEFFFSILCMVDGSFVKLLGCVIFFFIIEEYEYE